MASTRSTRPSDSQAPKRKRAAIIKFTFAGVALLGIGAAATSAAWTDDAWFTASAATVGTVHLQASLSSTTGFIDADTAPGIAIPSTVFGSINQGSTVTTTVYLKNSGTAPLTLGSAVITYTAPATGVDLFAAAGGAAVTAVPTTTSLAAGAVTPVTVTLTTPANWPNTYQGSTGTVNIKFTGQS